MLTEPSWAAQATASRWPLESRAKAIAVVDPPGGAIEPICDPSPASQPAVSWITIGAPWAAIVATRRPVTEVARSRAPAGPSPICAGRRVHDRRRRRGRITGDDRDAIAVDPDRRRRDDRSIERDLEGGLGGWVDEHEADPVAGQQIARERGEPSALRVPGREVVGSGRGLAGRDRGLDRSPGQRLAKVDGVARRRLPGGQGGREDRRPTGRDPGRLALGKLDRRPVCAGRIPAGQGRPARAGRQCEQPGRDGSRRRGLVRAGGDDDRTEQGQPDGDSAGRRGRRAAWPRSGRHRRGKCATPMPSFSAR